MDKNLNSLKKDVFTTLETILKACKLSIKAWDKRGTHIPVKFYSIIIDKAKWQKIDFAKYKNWSKEEKKVAGEKYNGVIVPSVNKMLMRMAESAITNAKGFGVDTVPVTFIEKTIQQMEKDFGKELTKLEKGKS